MQRNLWLAAFALANLASPPCPAQHAAPAQASPHDHRAMVPNGCQPLGTHRADELGCYILVQESVTALPKGPLYWHLDTFPDTAAARTARGANGSVVEAYGRTWLFTIADEHWRPQGGQHVASVGPFTPLTAGAQSAAYMVATTEANMDSLPHTHAGPEAFYVLEGAQCVETPTGTQTLKAGEGGTVAGGVPMKLYGAGDKARRALVLILHDAAQPVVIRNPAWEPRGACLAG